MYIFRGIVTSKQCHKIHRIQGILDEYYIVHKFDYMENNQLFCSCVDQFIDTVWQMT